MLVPDCTRRVPACGVASSATILAVWVVHERLVNDSEFLTARSIIAELNILPVTGLDLAGSMRPVIYISLRGNLGVCSDNRCGIRHGQVEEIQMAL